MSEKSTPGKGKRVYLKRSHRDEDEMDQTSLSEQGAASSPNRSLTKRFRPDPDPDIDLSGILSDDMAMDPEEDITRLFEDKFKEKSPASKLSSSFQHLEMNESNLLRQPKLSSHGRLTIGLTPEERERKRRMNRSLEFYPATPKSPERPPQSRSPKK